MSSRLPSCALLNSATHTTYRAPTPIPNPPQDQSLLNPYLTDPIYAIKQAPGGSKKELPADPLTRPDCFMYKLIPVL